MPLTENIQCPVCKSPENFRLNEQPMDFEYGVKAQREFAIHQCEKCSSRFVWPRPVHRELLSFYPGNYHAYNEDHGWFAGKLVALRDSSREKHYLELSDSRPLRIFDVGSGDCRHFDSLRASGMFEFGGIEINAVMVEKARSRGYDVHEGTLEEFDPAAYEESFDIVTMYQLVEHVLDPGAMLAKALRLLKPGGWVLGQLPCLDSIEANLFGKYWAGYHFPRHLQQFSRKGLEQCISGAGFADVKIKTALHLQAAISLQNWIVGNFPPRRELKFGKVPYYSALLLAVSPFCVAEYLLNRGGMMDFSASRPKR